MRAEGERYSSCWVKETWEYFILLTELNRIEGLTILVCWNWSSSLGGSLAVLEMRAEGERYSSCWVKQTWEYLILLPELNRIEGLTILVCLELEQFLRWFLSGSILK